MLSRGPRVSVRERGSQEGAQECQGLWVGTTQTSPSLQQQWCPIYPPGWVSLQFNWYTRRAVLAGIYNTTELVMMQDSSPDFEDTWRFLENRISDAMNMGHTAKQVARGSASGKPPH